MKWLSGEDELGEQRGYMAIILHEAAIKISKAQKLLKLSSGSGAWSLPYRPDFLRA